MESEPEKEIGGGPISVENWRRRESGVALAGTSEVPVYSDARLLGHGELGPYFVINTPGVDARLGHLRPVGILRAEDYTEGPVVVPEMDATNEATYHGGWLWDELGALCSLAMGVRIKTSTETRRFRGLEDRYGSPQAEWLESVPQLLVRGGRSRIPSSMGPGQLAGLAVFGDLPTRSAEDSIALIRSARAYQEALWLADSDPQLAWILMVSAVETAAGRWHTTDLSGIDLMRQQMSELASELEQRWGVEALEAVAKKFAQTMRATWRFNEFLLTFAPQPPAERASSSQLDWSKTSLRRVFQKVYHYRSRALHEGTPFPLPMCHVPFRHESWAGYAEVPTGLASAEKGAIWLRDDTPILLWTFEYIARNALLNWWTANRAS